MECQLEFPLACSLVVTDCILVCIGVCKCSLSVYWCLFVFSECLLALIMCLASYWCLFVSTGARETHGIIGCLFVLFAFIDCIGLH